MASEITIVCSGIQSGKLSGATGTGKYVKEWSFSGNEYILDDYKRL
jgi:hypothetical protein